MLLSLFIHAFSSLFTLISIQTHATAILLSRRIAMPTRKIA
ncbi:hypothetical protein JCM19237_5645 [Photobacterium aphoticum]|uniref:Uncharacterized protein n=1 Tax=Photobacterium aphoticum TaxID=754436 RepID=A0A090R528_9GAMM|nr:hypothetical protein JCM19237_5645 [Photobacterium aphoticum]